MSKSSLTGVFRLLALDREVAGLESAEPTGEIAVALKKLLAGERAGHEDRRRLFQHLHERPEHIEWLARQVKSRRPLSSR